MTAVPGKCRHCGCTEDNPCTLETGEHCLLNAQESKCSRPACILQEEARLRTLKPATRGLYPGWGFGAIVEDLRSKRRRGRRRKARAA